jgi:hypothetical protein
MWIGLKESRERYKACEQITALLHNIRLDIVFSVRPQTSISSLMCMMARTKRKYCYFILEYKSFVLSVNDI